MFGFGAAASTAEDHQQALDDVVPAVLAQVGERPDLVVCFFSMEHAEAAAGIALSLSERTGTATIIGCTAGGVIGGKREIEDTPALSVWAARLPGVDLAPFALDVVSLPEGYGVTGWPDLDPRARTDVVLLPDPFSFPAESFIRKLDEDQPGVRVIGGMVSGANQPGLHRLIVGTEALDSGAIGVAISGPVEVRTVVSQGCRPVGAPFTVTRAEGNLVHELGGQPALERLRELIIEASPADQALLMQGVQVGRVIDEHKASFDRGDFLIRSLIGVDEESGALAVGEQVEVGQTLQFHVRDAAAASEELDLLLAPVRGWDPQGALLFSCNGRGRRFFNQPDHDAGRVAAATGDAPMAGFFAQGELGPVGGRNFLHGFTASMALFRRRTEPMPALDRAAEPAREPEPEPPDPALPPDLAEPEAPTPT
ncbi:MAG TPA: FIST N-terminal domain-containing protein [Actinomycetes bacterium]